MPLDPNMEMLMRIVSKLEENQTKMQKLLESQVSQPQNGAAGQATSGKKCQTSLISDLAKRIPTFSFNPETETTFNDWFSRYEQIFVEDGVDLDDKTRLRVLLEKLDPECWNRFCSHILPDKPNDLTFKDAVDKLKTIFDIPMSIFTKRYLCWTSDLDKNPGEDDQAYGDRVNEKLHKNMENITIDELKVLRYFIGLKTNEDKEHLPYLLSYADRLTAEKKTVKLQDVINELKRLRSFKHDGQLISNATNSEINKVFGKKNVQNSKNCWNCGKNGHYAKDCRSTKKFCKKCNKTGHTIENCYKNPSNQQKNKGYSKKKQISAVKIVEPEKDFEKSEKNEKNRPEKVQINSLRRYSDVLVNNRKITFQTDTGADVTLINEDSWKKIGSPKLKSPVKQLKTANDTEMACKGSFACEFVLCGEKGVGDAYVVSGNNLLGLEWLNQSKLVTKSLDSFGYAKKIQKETNFGTKSIDEVLISNFPQVFEPGLGTCVKESAKLTLKDGVNPKFCSARPVPYAARESVEKELDRLMEMGVIEPITHSKWAAPIVCVSKKQTGKIRVCSDFSTGLNNALVDNKDPLPTADDIFASLNGGTVFSQIDLSDAYLQLELDEESKNLVVINSHRGLYRYNRLPFGVKTAPAIFQSIMAKMTAGLKGVATYLDDILVKGDDKTEHDQNLMALFERINDYGFKVKIEKCSFHQKQVKFLGYLVDKNGRKPDPEKITAISKMPTPTNVNQLRSFLGMCSYYGNFIPKMKQLRGILDELTQKDVKWDWNDSRQQAFDKLIEILSSDLNLCHFNPKYPIIVAADACEYGIGGVISHKFPDGTEKPIHHFSQALNPAEKNYSQIEKEALGLVTAVKRFHKYIFGRKFLLKTDHKPLLAIYGSKSGLPAHSVNRLIRWGILLLGYDFSMEYVKTDCFGQADALSRLISRANSENEDKVIAKIENETENTFDDKIRRLPVTAEHIRAENLNDSVIKTIMGWINETNWPKNGKGLDPVTKSYFDRKSELSVIQGCLMVGERVAIPEKLQRKVLIELHRGHSGIVRSKQLARSVVFWSGLDREIEKFVNNCEKCQKVAKMPVKVPLSPWPEPERIWQRVHIDYAGPVDGQYILVMVDSLSKWPEALLTKSISAISTVKLLESVFSRFGYPETIVSDNGTQFCSKEFNEMCQLNGIKHIRTAPYHPMSNGRAERFVDTLKRGLKKIKGEGESVSEQILNKFLFAYRSTPSSILNGRTPAESFLERKIRTRLSLLIPTKKVNVSKSENKAEKDFNRHHGVRQKYFETGDLVWFRKHHPNGFKWLPGKVKQRNGKVSYLIETDGGKMVHSHANQLRKREIDVNCRKEVFLDTMMHTFNIVPPQPVMEEGCQPVDGAANDVADSPAAVHVPLRRSSRSRRAPNRLQY